MRKAGSEYIFENNNHTILLQNIMLTDKGVFKCLVQNKYGSFVHNINLVPEGNFSSLLCPFFYTFVYSSDVEIERKGSLG